MASDQPKKTKTRRLRASSETVRERSQGGHTLQSSAQTQGKVRSVFQRINNLPVWKPFKATGRFLAKYLIPPYFKNSWRELRMVTWPNAKQTRQLTFAVIIFSVIFGVLVALVDFGLDKLFKKVILHI